MSAYHRHDEIRFAIFANEYQAAKQQIIRTILFVLRRNFLLETLQLLGVTFFLAFMALPKDIPTFIPWPLEFPLNCVQQAPSHLDK